VEQDENDGVEYEAPGEGSTGAEDEDQQEDHMETEAQGTADEGERIPRIVQQMEIEDLEAIDMEQIEDSSDDEADEIPSE